jgi:hypothetical protein
MLSAATLILNQSEENMSNGHYQMTISQLKMKEALQLCRDMQDYQAGLGLEVGYVLEIWPGRVGDIFNPTSGSIYAVGNHKDGGNQLILSIDNLLKG